MTGEAAIRINENSVIRESIYGKRIRFRGKAHGAYGDKQYRYGAFGGSRRGARNDGAAVATGHQVSFFITARKVSRLFRLFSGFSHGKNGYRFRLFAQAVPALLCAFPRGDGGEGDYALPHEQGNEN